MFTQGMNFIDDEVPNFGSIYRQKKGDFVLNAADISKLNSILTRSNCESKLKEGQIFNIESGTVAIVADWKTANSSKVYMYESSSDSWYEFIEGEE